MPTYTVRIHTVTEHQISGLEAATDFAINAIGAKAEVVSDEGLVILTIIPQGKPEPVEAEPAPEPKTATISNVSVADNFSLKVLTKEVKPVFQNKRKAKNV